jgi:hypothetical protein
VLTRRGLLKSAAGAAGVMTLGGAALGAAHALSSRHKLRKLPSLASPAGPGPWREFVSRPDLHPPAVSVTGGGVDPGYVFLGPGAGAQEAGPLMVDERGEPVWFQPISKELWLSNFRTSQYNGQRVLTWWEGHMTLRG